MSLRARSASLRVDSARQSSPGASSIIAGEPCAVIVVRPHELRDRRVRDVACFEFRVYAVSSRLKAELRAVSSTLCPPDQDGRGHRYASAYPRAGGLKAINSRPKAGILVREEVRENRRSQIFCVGPPNPVISAALSLPHGKWRNHEHAIALHCFVYNFCRKDMSLGATPAVAAGIFSRP